MSLIIGIVTLLLLISVLKTDIYSKEKEVMARFAVMTDMHFFPQQLINTESKSYQTYLKQDAKLTLESGAVIQAAINEIITRKLDFVILAGDITNEGEKQSHIQLSKILQQFTDNNIPVFLTPGNHDINNGIAASFLADKAVLVDSVNEDEFEEIYYKYGFEQAYSRDDNTLSYCAEISKDVHLILLDANQYRYQKNSPIPDGILPPDTLNWAVEQISAATDKGIRMIGVMHHGLVEHFLDQGKTFAPFLVRNYQEIGRQLSKAGLDFIFTGHLHAQDVSSAVYEGYTIYDIETAALTSAPFAWRQLTLKADELEVETVYIEDIDFDYGSEEPFRAWATNRVWKGLVELESYFLQHHNGLTPEQTNLVAPYYARAFMAHFCGDEKPGKEDVEFYEKHRSDPRSPFHKIASIFNALWADTSEDDINLSIPLRKLPL